MCVRCIRLCFVFGLLCGVSEAVVLINEVHYDPDVKTEPVEFIELFNSGSGGVDVSAWALDRGVEFVFPGGTLIPAGGFLVVAADPAALLAKYGVTALGPWSGRLSNEGEEVRLLDALGEEVASVEYGRGFPWPIVGDPPGYSIELVNPAMDPDLGGNWRASDANASGDLTLIPEDDVWSYFKGTSEASVPADAWRQPGFDASAWASGPLTIGYGEGFVNTLLSDMQGGYRAVMLRKEFVVTNLAAVGNLQLEVVVDDGFNAWLNGAHVATFNLPGTNLAFTANASSAIEDLSFQTFNLPAGTSLAAGTNVLCIQFHNASLGGSSDAVLNARLLSVGALNPGPTPGALNSVFSPALPPRVRQVKHTPRTPLSGEPVTIQAKVSDSEDGVSSVQLLYQVVDPGQYIAIDDPAYATNWTALAMSDADGDAIYEVSLPGTLQQHRRLMRYRIVSTDGAGNSIQSPYLGDPEPNFAYFCYDGVPAWSGAVQPGSTPVQTFGTNVMGSLPVYHVISSKQEVEDSTWFDRYTGSDYRYTATLVHDGEVYDHIGFRSRGGVWRYAMGKNMWKFNFNRAHRLQARDDFGRPYREKWDKLNFSSLIQQGNFWHRGEQGLFETAGFKLFELMGVEGPKTHFAHFRVIDEAAEVGATQYDGDFWGLYLAIEQLDGGFLDEHDLPDGNLYKMESGTGTLNNQGASEVTDRSDLDSFLTTYNNTTPTDQWWRDNLDLDRYYGYRSVVEGIHHYDIANGKNYFYFLNPDNAKWQVVPWDLDLTWADNMFGTGNEPFKTRVINRPVFEQAYQNRMREFRDLLYNGDQGDQLLDDIASRINDPAGALSFVDADRARWDYNPILDDATYIDRFTSNKARTGRYYQGNGGSIQPPTSDFEGMVQMLKDYITSRGAWIDSNLIADADIPATPTLSYTGMAGHPIDQLTFDSSGFVDASGSFQAIEWRVGEVTDPLAPGYDSAAPPVYEMSAVWASGPVLPTLSVAIPPNVLEPGLTYRVRVRHQDSSDKCSHWSTAYEFTAGQAVAATTVTNDLRVSELMYNSPAGSDFDFIEFVNTSAANSLDLSNVEIRDGVTYAFPAGTSLAPGARLVVAKLPGAAFDAYYGLSGVTVLGPYSGNFNNGGERVQVVLNGGIEIIDFTYNDACDWPCAADGAGHSLIPQSMADQRSGALDVGAGWRRSRFIKGSPGAADPALVSGLVINEFAAHTDLSDPAFPGYDSNDWIELYNAGTSVVSQADLYLSDDDALLTAWALPSGVVGVGAWTSFDEISGFNAPPGTGFGLNKAGENIFLSHLPAGAPGAVLDCLCFEGQPNGQSSGRFVDGGAGGTLMDMTRDAANRPPIYTAVINELMYHPTTNQMFEFIELTNPRTNAVDLFNVAGPFRIDGGVDYTFPAGISLAAGETILLLPFDPGAVTTSALFYANYGVTPAAQAFGPWSGNLGNGSGRISLQAPQAPDAPGDLVSWVVLDEVIYVDESPWDAAADGLGDALHRRFANLDGHAPGNWEADVPSPGVAAPGLLNWAPVLDAAGPFSLLEGTPLVFTNTFDDWNVDQLHSWSLEPGAPAGALLSANGVFDWTPPLGSGGAIYTVGLRISDNGSPALSHTQAVQISVLALPNQPPVIVSPGTQIVAELSNLMLPLSASDPDFPTQAVQWVLGPGAPLGASIDVNSGLLSWTPGELDGPGSFVVSVIASDDGAPPLAATQVLSITVTEVDTAPSLIVSSAVSVIEGQFLMLTNLASDVDLPAEVLRFSLLAGPSGVVVDTMSGLLSWTPSEADGPGVYTAIVAVADSGPSVLTTQAAVVISVLESNQAPLLAALPQPLVMVGQTVSVTVVASDPDLPAQTLLFGLSAGAPAGLSVSATGQLTWVPSAGGTGVHTAEVTVSDGALVDRAMIVIRVAPEPLIVDLDFLNLSVSQQISWPSLAGVKYRLDWSPQLIVPTWTPVGSMTASGAMSSLPHSVPLDTRVFYRVVLLPSP